MLLELRPKKELLDPNFGGYKLSLDSIPVYRQNLHEEVDHVCQNDEQYSFVHTKVFTLHNHLYSDPWHEGTVYVVDSSWNILKASINQHTGRTESLQTVWKIPNRNERRPGHFNTSILFPAADLVVVADGCGRLHVLSCLENSQWKCAGGCEEAGSELVSSRLAADSTLHVVLMSLDTVRSGEQESSEMVFNKPRAAPVQSRLDWLLLAKDDSGQWSVSCYRRLEGTGCVDYVALEIDGSALFVCSEAGYKFTADSANPLTSSKEVTGPEHVYTWEQSADDVKFTLEVGENITRDCIEVKVTDAHMVIRCGQKTSLEGTLGQHVDTDLTTCTLQQGRLEVTLCKKQSGLMWSELIVGDTRGHQLIDPAFVSEVHERIGHLTTDTEVQESGEGLAPSFNLDQLEECDSAPEDNRMLVRFDPISHSATHQVTMAGHQWLMAVQLGPDCPPALCVRHDVDGVVWCLDPLLPADSPCQHIGTFSALGYVAASKQQKKYMVAAPDLSYSVICEANSHVFVYERESRVSGELRNRRTNAKLATIAKQRLINLESSDTIYGAQASNSHLFVLTQHTLYTFHIS